MNRNFGDGDVCVDIRVTAISETDLKEFMSALRKIQFCGELGMNRLIPIMVDGDGSGRINVEVHTIENTDPRLRNLNEIVILGGDKLQKVIDGDDFETHFIGE